ncbi:hypothetical protein SAMN05443428_10218 [Caloramator quimbayensis]|uniref:Uncharacterized protein n=1 Tax=Caloramator quimbayensis TaxID=1147123 RepID=A0A1T4WJ70_9CLOT|nr:hypothetical protein [Caloramator quimbayensis]SKA77394.1 hypothetical protein SAMN05443428_10218 [Caloramator quimbayensis]
MKIIIKTQGFKCKVPIYVPMAFAKLAVKVYIKKKAINNENIKYIETIDFNLLNQSFNILKEYKGLKIVDVHSSDGTVVEIWL